MDLRPALATDTLLGASAADDIALPHSVDVWMIRMFRAPECALAALHIPT